jgi:hypothetical protein
MLFEVCFGLEVIKDGGAKVDKLNEVILLPHF